LSHIADIIRRPRVAVAMNSSSISDVQAKSRQRLSGLCHIRCVLRPQEKYPGVLDSRRCLRSVLEIRGIVTANDVDAERPKKKEAGFPAPLAMTTEVWLVFFLATVSTSAQSLHPEPRCGRAVHDCSQTRLARNPGK